MKKSVFLFALMTGGVAFAAATVTKAYVDKNDAETLEAARTYTDEKAQSFSTPADYETVKSNAATALSKANAAATADALTAETARAQAAEKANADAIAAETTARQSGDASNASAIAAETTRAKAAEQANADALTAETARAKAAEDFNADAIINHADNTANPHAVTAAQVGAYTKAETDEKIASATPGDYATVSNKAYTAVQTETDPTFAEWKGGKSIVAGQGASANGSTSVAIGYECVVSAKTNATAVGVKSRASSSYASAGGYYNIAQSSFSSAFGGSNIANGMYSSAFGHQNSAGSEDASAFGRMNYAMEYQSSAFGWYNTANGERSSAFGYQNEANAWGSSAFGYYCKANGQSSCAFGYLAYTGTDEDKWFGSLAFSQTPDLIYLNSSTADSGASARTLASYLDERATTNALAALEKTVAAKADASAISADNAAFSAAVRVAAKALVRERLAALDRANSSIGETIAALQSIYADDTDTATETSTEE